MKHIGLDKYNPYTLAILVEEAAHYAAKIDCGVGYEKLSSAQLQLGRWWRGDFAHDSGINDRRQELIDMAAMIYDVIEQDADKDSVWYEYAMDAQWGRIDRPIEWGGGRPIGAWDCDVVPHILRASFFDAEDSKGVEVPDHGAAARVAHAIKCVVDASMPTKTYRVKMERTYEETGIDVYEVKAKSARQATELVEDGRTDSEPVDFIGFTGQHAQTIAFTHHSTEAID